MASSTLPNVIPATQGPSVPVGQIGRIKSVLWSRCSGSRFVGIQKAYDLRPGGDLILFSPPGNGPTGTLCVPVSLWLNDIDAFVALVQHKIIHEILDADIRAIKAGIRL